MGIAAGDLDRRITLQRHILQQDEMNEGVPIWVELGAVWAKFSPLSDGERFRASETAATASARFLIRYSTAVAELNANDRLTFGEVVYQVLHVKEIGRREGIEITAAARADG